METNPETDQVDDAVPLIAFAKDYDTFGVHYFQLIDQAGMKKALILFVHGIDGSSKTTWGAFPKLVQSDDELGAKHDVALDDYPTRKTGRLFERIGGLDAAAEGLKSRLANYYADYDDVAIIAHSQGGLIALRYMLDRIMRTESMPLTRLLTYATPYGGAMGGSVGAFFGIGSEQAMDLASEGDFLFRLNRDWGLLRDQHRVAMKVVIAGCDGVVGASSVAALGIPYDLAASFNHQTIVKPDSAVHESFIIAKRFLLGATGRSRLSSLKNAIKLPEGTRTDLQTAWEKLDDRLRQKSNLWQDEWNELRSRFEGAYAGAVETGCAESWQTVIEAGSDLREQIRTSVEDELDLPVHYTALTAYTDKVQIALKVAGATPGNALPPEHEKLIADIEALEEKTEGERALLSGAIEAVEIGSQQRQIDELFQRLDDVESELAASKSMAIQVEQFNIAKVDSDLIIALIRDSLAALKHGTDLLDDKRFTETLRQSAKAARLMGKRYIRAVRRRFAALKLPWRQQTVFDDFEHQERDFSPPNNDLTQPQQALQMALQLAVDQIDQIDFCALVNLNPAFKSSRLIMEAESKTKPTEIPRELIKKLVDLETQKYLTTPFYGSNWVSSVEYMCVWTSLHSVSSQKYYGWALFYISRPAENKIRFRASVSKIENEHMSLAYGYLNRIK